MDLQPHFSITANGNEIAESLRERIVEVVVTERTGLLSDTCYIKFDNLGKAPIQLPKQGDKVEIAVGYKQGSEDGNAPLKPLGFFEIGEFNLNGPLRSLELFGNKVLWHKGFKTPKQRSWPETPEPPQKLKDLIGKIAGEYGLEAKVAPEFESTTLAQIEQSESDMQLLSKLADQFDAVMKITNDKLVFMPKGTGKSLSGKDLDKIELDNSELLNWCLNRSFYKQVGEVSAYYHDLNTAERVEVKSGSGVPALVLPYLFADEASALAATKSKSVSLTRSFNTLKLTVIGHSGISAGHAISVANTDTEADGDWYVSAVTHCIDQQGFRSHLVCESLS